MLSKLGASAIVILCATSVVYGAVPELPPIPTDLSTPVSQRIAFNGPTGMTVAWNTFKPLSKPTVHYGLLPNLLLHTATSSSSVTYNTSRTWANTVRLNALLPATTYYYKIDSTNSTIDSFKTARLAGDPTPFAAALVIDMGVFGPDGLSERNVSYTNKTVTYPLKPAEHTTIQQLVKSASSYEFVLHPGDLAYADAWLKELLLNYINGTIADGPAIYEGLTEQFYQELSAVSRMKPYMVTAGNHEANCVNGGTGGYTEAICPQGQTNFTQFINRFGLVMPGASSQSPLQRSFGLDGLDDHPLDMFKERSSPSVAKGRSLSMRETQAKARRAAARTRAITKGAALAPFWYSFDYGMAHFLIIDTETDLGVGLVGPDELGGGQADDDGPFGSYQDQQIDFIEKDLAAVDRLVTPWVVVAGHRPWYVSNSAPCPTCQSAFEHLLLKYGVDLAVFGHTHNSQLIVPVAYNVTDPAGWNNPTAPAYIVQGAAGHFEGLEPLLATPPPYLAWGIDTVYGFSKLLFKDRHNLELQFIASDTGDVLHSQVLYKNHTTRFFGH